MLRGQPVSSRSTPTSRNTEADHPSIVLFTNFNERNKQPEHTNRDSHSMPGARLLKVLKGWYVFPPGYEEHQLAGMLAQLRVNVKSTLDELYGRPLRSCLHVLSAQAAKAFAPLPSLLPALFRVTKVVARTGVMKRIWSRGKRKTRQEEHE
ncbi:hypothetical protein Cob_v010906 [Colletotrichum orbiculare MAFF 240422]|uniref:Uncharacterized protein n=1 Tax=Colletotrichum orbiculare (strain 104-T / ATCC 96160 / CBS 514.97 / LARS 414 / MAFF 240422) TaxID=1213857 RepID=A0A484FDX8_COLOR|nr:hypothetical protein Cob_v010906 [Colletotrichum orbiculare MAFF 240422]